MSTMAVFYRSKMAMCYVSTGMGYGFSALLMFLMALRLHMFILKSGKFTQNP